MENVQKPFRLFSFNSLLAACFPSENYDKMLQRLQELPSKLSIEPNIVSFTLAVCCAHYQDFITAVDDLRSLLSAVDSLKSSLYNSNSQLQNVAVPLSSEKMQQNTELMQQKIGLLYDRLQLSDEEVQYYFKLCQDSMKEFQDTLNALKEKSKKRTEDEAVHDKPYEFWSSSLLLVDGWYQKTFHLVLIHLSLYVSDSDEIEDAEGSGEYKDEEVVIPLKNMKTWLERRPREFGEGKVYDTSIEDKLMEEIEWENSFVRELPGDPKTNWIPREILHSCYTRLSPSAEVDNPQLFAWFDSVAESRDLDKKEFERPDSPQIFSGASSLVGAMPYAQCYGGHQFGMWAVHCLRNKLYMGEYCVTDNLEKFVI